ncbi:MAG: LacI family DNA-binding transcriptional regulator [Alistipes sp.]
MEKETLVSVARRTGYSISTISRILNGNAVKYRISEKAVELVMAEVRACNYTPSMLAKGLRTNRTDTIGLLIPSIENPFFATIAGVVIRELRTLNYKVVVVDTQEDDRFEIDGLSALLARRVDGIIAAPCGNDPVPFLRIRDNGIPVVMIDRYLPNSSEFSYVTTDNYQGAIDATEYLIANGHTQIVCIQGSPHSMPDKNRVRGYIDTLQRHNLGKNAVIRGENFSVENGYYQTKLALSSGSCPTAIFALSNTILLGVIKAVNESGLHIPDDISVVSFDDNQLFNYLNPAITCIRQPINEIGTLAAKMLIENIRGIQIEPVQLHLTPELIVRKSVKDRQIK